MSFITSITGNGKNWITENPAGFSTLVLFGLGFSLVAANALVSQSERHSAPFWQTRIKTNSTLTETRVSSDVRLPTHAVLTQRISLTNIPVPTANPVKVYRISAQSSLVREVQSILGEVGIYSGKVDGIFGDATKNAILEYQKQAGIIPNGEASYGLLGSIKSAFAVAQIRAKIDGPAKSLKSVQLQMIVLDTATVQKVQIGLRDIYGEDQMSVDGIIGNQTRNAIRQFQKRFKLEVTGEIDHKTMGKLREAGIVGST